MGRIRIGTSGWRYDDWHGPFYPEGLPRSRELAYAAAAFDTVEINATFYGLRRPRDFRRWRDAAPAPFRFAVKGGRFLTHVRKLKDPEPGLANFFASGLLSLGEKLGPVLWQLPPGLRFSEERLEAFLRTLPRTTGAMAERARRHEGRTDGAVTRSSAQHRVRHAVEPRHESFFCSRCVRLLRRHGAALVFSHGGGWPYAEELTAGFVYLRLHGRGATYEGAYGREALGRWAGRIRAWRGGGEPGDAVRVTGRAPPRRKERDVYVYFDNDRHAHAPSDALLLREALGGEV